MKSKLGSAILALVIAFGLWLYVMSVENPEHQETYSGIPVNISGEGFLTERGLMITGGTDSTATIRVSGSRSDLYKLKPSDITLIADVSNISKAGEHQVTYTVRYPGDIASGALQTQSRTPDAITLTVEEKITKTLEIEPIYSGVTSEDYWVDKENAKLVDVNDTEVPLTTITVSGPKSVMDQITRATISVDLNGRTQSFWENYRPTLCNSAGEPVDLKGLVQANIGEVRLELRIQRIKEIPLKLNVVAGGGATEETSTIDILPKTIRVSGNETILEGLEFVDLGTLKLGDLESDTELAFGIFLPQGITNLSDVDEALVKVSFPTLQIREFKVENIRAINVPQGMEVEFLTQSVTVKVRGPHNAIQAITANDLTVVVDFTNVAPGTATIKARIEVNYRFPGVGAMDTYSISATLREIAAAAEEE